MAALQRFKRDLNLCFSIFKRIFSGSALFVCPQTQIGRQDWRLKMSEENTSQKERFLQEVEQKLLRKELDARLLEDGLIRVKWNGQPLCSVDRDGIVRFRPADITGPEVDRQLRTVTQTISQKHRRNPAKRLRR